MPETPAALSPVHNADIQFSSCINEAPEEVTAISSNKVQRRRPEDKFGRVSDDQPDSRGGY